MARHRPHETGRGVEHVLPGLRADRVLGGDLVVAQFPGELGNATVVVRVFERLASLATGRPWLVVAGAAIFLALIRQVRADSTVALRAELVVP